MTIDNKGDYISAFVTRLEHNTQSYKEDIYILNRHCIINPPIKNKLVLLYEKWYHSNITADNSNEFNLMINLMYKAIKDYEDK